MRAPGRRRLALAFRSPSVLLLAAIGSILLGAASLACHRQAALRGAAAADGPEVARDPGPVGLLQITAEDPLARRSLPVAVFHPAVGGQGVPAQVGPWPLEAHEGLPVAPGVHPVVVISHGYGGGRFGHHDLAEALARAGFIAAAVQHLDDDPTDQTGEGTARSFLARPGQASAALDAVLRHPTLGPHADGSRAGVAGFSAGGYTALALAGARPDFSLIAGYCRRRPEDREICALKAGVARAAAPPRALRDPRIGAVFAMAPVGLFFAWPGAFEDLRAPVALVVADGDRVLLPAENAEPVRRGTRLALDVTLPGAGHYVFLAPCGPVLTRHAPELCTDPPGVDRAAVHARVGAEAVRFFRRVLAVK